MGKINFKQYTKQDLPDNVKWLEDRTILFTKYGSHIYGTNTPESDLDFKGVAIPPKEYLLGLQSINEYNKSGGKNFGERNTKDDVDLVIMALNKFVSDAIKGVPNNMDILFCRDEDIIYMDDFGKELRDIRKEFLSKRIFNKFSGYALSQKHKLEVKKNHGVGRIELVDEFGYDTKFAMHSLRLLYSAIEILETHNYCSYRPEEQRKLLLEVRSGKYTMDEVFDMFEKLDLKLKELYETSTLRLEPDYNKINNWLIDVNERALNYKF